MFAPPITCGPSQRSIDWLQDEQLGDRNTDREPLTTGRVVGRAVSESSALFDSTLIQEIDEFLVRIFVAQVFISNSLRNAPRSGLDPDLQKAFTR
ncbi:MAG: hypothetical protein JWP89_749 [Schlesneria sp.]|nr:hypothetical protein [Schlesneria sp.]